MRHTLVALSSLVLAASSQIAGAAELSLVSGLYRQSESKVANTDAGGESTIGAGARLSDALDAKFSWYAEALLELKSYDSGKGGKAPSDSTSLALGGGLRYWFAKWSETLTPFGYGGGTYKNEKHVDINASNNFDETETSGLFYGASVGLRLALDTDFFVDLETSLFESALFATQETESTSTDPTSGLETKSERETTRTELYVDTTGAFEDVRVALGMKF